MVTVTLEQYNTNIRSRDFQIEIANICETTTDITPSSLIKQDYYVTKPPQTNTPAILAFDFNPTYCPFSYTFIVDPALPGGVVAFDTSLIEFTYSTSDQNLIGLY